MSYTTPRTANVDDDFTSAWYNAEVKANIVWLHDTLLSVGSSFPASPAAGQRHWFVSGTVRKLFVSDGSHWYSDAERINVLPYPGDAITTPTTPTALNNAIREPLHVADQMNASMTLQGRIGGLLTQGASTPNVGLRIATIASPGAQLGSYANAAGTEIVGDGWHEGAWADLLAPASVIAGVLGLYAYRTAGGFDTLLINQIYAEVRWKL